MMSKSRDKRAPGARAKLIVFEGIDGSGKTTLSNRVAKLLAARGLVVRHVRAGGKLASSTAEAIRELARDQRHMLLSPVAEMLLNAARDVQQRDEAMLPALADADVVIADRFACTAHVMATSGRGLPDELVRPIVDVIARGVEPDLTILIDVDPHVARARRRVAKIVTPDPRPSSRKGLAGVGMQHRLRAGYLALAERDPMRWVVVDNTDADLDAVAESLVNLVRAALDHGVPAIVSRHREGSGPARQTVAPVLAGPGDALRAFFDWVDRRSVHEPGVAAYFLSGLAGGGVDERRVALAARAPEVIAYGLRGLPDSVSWQLRRALVSAAPRWVARSLVATASEGEDAWRLRDELAPVVPAAVASSLDGHDGALAWRLRERLYGTAPDAVLSSLKRVASAQAWAVRDRWLTERGGERAALATFALAAVAAISISGLDDERAWAIRRAARAVAPVPALESLHGLTSERAWKWRNRYLASATKIVLHTVSGMDDPHAWALREAVAPMCKEALDSMVGMDGEPAWRIRAVCADVWPSTVVKSLGALAATPRGADLLTRQLARHATNVSLLKSAAALALAEPAAARAVA